ncbi:MAG: hypothetical protein RL637_1184 [Pseudomonadota bacterium]
MHVSVEKTSELSRKMTVSFTEAEIQPKIESQFKTLAHQAKIDGFRPGKVPQHILKKRYHSQVRKEVTTELVQESYPKALEEQNLDPIGQPQIHPVEQAEGFAYTAEFELAPVVSFDNLAQIQATRFQAQVEEADFEKMLLGLRQQKCVWSEIDRPAANGDRVIFNFGGTPEDGDKTQLENQSVIIGQRADSDFDKQLIGAEIGQVKTLTFADDSSPSKEEVNFKITVVAIQESALPEIDAEFVRQYGVEDGNLETFYSNVRNNMERELQRVLQAETKKSVLHEVYAYLNIPVPTVLVNQEINRMIQSVIEEAQQRNVKPQELDFPKQFFESQAHYRVALGFILSQVLEHAQIQLDEQRVKMTLEDMAENYEDPEEFVRWHYEDRKRLEPIVELVMENQAVDWLMSQIQMKDETESFAKIMDRQQR